MDGGETIEFQPEQVVMGAEAEEEIIPMDAVVAEEEHIVQVNIGQPTVLVERVPDHVILEEAITPNGTEEESSTAAALNDIIADAVDGEEEALAENNESVVAEEDQEQQQVKEEVESPRKKEEPSLDLNQCRCCTSREDLQDIFESIKPEIGLPISSVITKLCTNLTITKRDHLPNVICRNCVYKLQIAWEIKELCEKTDKELRKSLPRAKKVSRKRDYTLIDYESSSGEDAGANDDEDEFKLSDELEDASDASDSDVDFEEAVPKKRGRPKKIVAKATPSPVVSVTPRGRGRPRKDATPLVVKGKVPRAPIVYVQAKKQDTDSDEDEEEEEDEDEVVKPKSGSVTKRCCPKCKVVIVGASHVCKAGAFSCTFCSEKFATHPLYMNHQQLHTNFQNANTCVRCHKQFPDKPQLRKHQSGVRCQKALKNDCSNCGRVLANASQLAIHLRTKCMPANRQSGGATVKKEAKKETPKKDQNLFKFVAPPTSTYWSDSFSD